MNKLNNVLNIVSTVFCVVMITILFIFNLIVNGVYFNGYVVLILLCMLLNPIANLCRTNKKIINNPIYHMLIILVTSYITYISRNALLIYKNNLNGTPDNSNALNLAGLYFGDRFIYIFIALVLLVLITFLSKKKKVESNKDNLKIMMLIIFITSLIPFFTKITTMEMIWSLSETIFLIITFVRTRNIGISSELQKYYILLMILSIFSINPIALVLSIYMFIQTDKLGLNI